MIRSPFFNQGPDRIILTTTDAAIHRMAEAAIERDRFFDFLGGQWVVDSIATQQNPAGYSAVEIVLVRVMHALVAEIRK